MSQKLNISWEKVFIIIITLYYGIKVVTTNLNDDHGIIIIGGLQASENLLPGLDTYNPHGILAPLLLGYLIKLTNILNIDWQFAYISISVFLFLLFIKEIKILINNLFH